MNPEPMEAMNTDTPETDQAERESIAAYIDADSPVIYGASLVIPTNPSWANSPIHQEVQEWEKESIHSQYVNKPSETLVAERDRLDDQLDQIILRLGETQERMIDAERHRDRLAEERDEILAQLREEQQLHVQTLNERDEARKWESQALVARIQRDEWKAKYIQQGFPAIQNKRSPCRPRCMEGGPQ